MNTKEALIQIGADWDKSKCVLAWMFKEEWHTGKVKRNPVALLELREKLQALVGSDVKLKIEVAIEPGDTYWIELWEEITNDIFVFDGKKTRRYEESLGSTGAQDDARSAKTLYGMLQSSPHRLRRNIPLDGKENALSLLQREYDKSRSLEIEFENRLRSNLRKYRAQLDLSGKFMKTKGFLEILTVAPTAADWNRLSDKRKANLLKPFRKERREELAKQLSYEQPNTDNEVREFAEALIPSLVQLLKAAKQSAERFLALIEKKHAEYDIPEALTGIKGVGVVFTNIFLLAYWRSQKIEEVYGEGDRDSMSRLLGSSPVTKRSGVRGEKRPSVVIRRGIRTEFKGKSFLIGNQLAMRHVWAKAAYAHYRSQGHSAGTAYRKITRSFLRVLDAMLRDGGHFDERKYIQRLKRQRVEWALKINLDELDALSAKNDDVA